MIISISSKLLFLVMLLFCLYSFFLFILVVWVEWYVLYLGYLVFGGMVSSGVLSGWSSFNVDEFVMLDEVVGFFDFCCMFLYFVVLGFIFLFGVCVGLFGWL